MIDTLATILMGGVIFGAIFSVAWLVFQVVRSTIGRLWR